MRPRNSTRPFSSTTMPESRTERASSSAKSGTPSARRTISSTIRAGSRPCLAAETTMLRVCSSPRRESESGQTYERVSGHGGSKCGRNVITTMS